MIFLCDDCGLEKGIISCEGDDCTNRLCDDCVIKHHGETLCQACYEVVFGNRIDSLAFEEGGLEATLFPIALEAFEEEELLPLTMNGSFEVDVWTAL